jgi:hypothetical protein
MTQNTSTAASAMKMPTCRPCRIGLPQITGSLAPATMSLEIGTSCFEGSDVCSGPLRLNAHTPTQSAIQLSMIVEITSLVPAIAFNAPAMPAHSAPAAQPPRIASTMCRKPGMSANEEPIHTAASEPMMNCPWPPMLNSPQRNANATASPVRISGVVLTSVCCRLSEAAMRSSSLVHGKSQLSPVPLKIAR